jgi:hypothetical protein
LLASTRPITPHAHHCSATSPVDAYCNKTFAICSLHNIFRICLPTDWARLFHFPDSPPLSNPNLCLGMHLTQLGLWSADSARRQVACMKGNKRHARHSRLHSDAVKRFMYLCYLQSRMYLNKPHAQSDLLYRSTTLRSLVNRHRDAFHHFPHAAISHDL